MFVYVRDLLRVIFLTDFGLSVRVRSWFSVCFRRRLNKFGASFLVILYFVLCSRDVISQLGLFQYVSLVNPTSDVSGQWIVIIYIWHRNVVFIN